MFRAQDFVPSSVNQGSWLTAWTLPRLLERLQQEAPILPICPWGAAPDDLRSLGGLVLPPLYREAMSPSLCDRMLKRIARCFPFLEGDPRRTETQVSARVVEINAPIAPLGEGPRPRVAAFSVDTAVEQHGPHLPLATDTIQSYGVLQALADEVPDLRLAPPVDYGHLTWGLPFGVSIDLGPGLLSEYVAGYARLVNERWKPEALYVVDVHGSIVHRNAIQEGLRSSGAPNWRFRWLHEPLVSVSGERGDQHAGGVETAILEFLNPALVDRHWFPARREQLAAGQMNVNEAAELSGDLTKFRARTMSGEFNGIVGDLRNYDRVSGAELFERMLAVARSDLAALLNGG